MKLSRRFFLKSGSAVTLLALPIIPFKIGSLVDLGNGEKGQAIQWGRDDEIEFLDIRDTLINLARKQLHVFDRFEIRQMLPNNYGLEEGMAWYHSPRMNDPQDWEVFLRETRKEAKYEPALGVYMVARLIA